MPMNDNFKTPYNYGDIRYVSGSKTKIKVIGDLDSAYPLCEVLAITKGSTMYVGQKRTIYRRILYLKQQR